MLTNLDVLGGRSNVPSLPLGENGSAATDPLQVFDLQGIEPVKAAVTTMPYATFDGEAYSGGASVGKRNIVLAIGLNPDWAIQTIEELRQLVYAYFLPKARVRLQFTSTHLPKVAIDGIVESVTPNIFSKDPQMQISIICPMPDFVSVDDTVIKGLTVASGGSLFEFHYNGTTPAGFYMELTRGDYEEDAPGSDLRFSITLNNEYCNQLLRGRGKITRTDYTAISTVPGDKYLRSVVYSWGEHAGRMYGYLTSVQTNSNGWPKIFPGSNGLLVATPNSPRNKYSLSFYERFGGL